MIYVFSSAYYALFQQNVLNALCYPDEHVMRLRYDAKYVQEAIRRTPASIVGKDALLVFAEGAISNRIAKERNSSATMQDYRFYPIRHCTICGAETKADIFFLDVRLRQFVTYSTRRFMLSQS